MCCARVWRGEGNFRICADFFVGFQELVLSMNLGGSVGGNVLSTCFVGRLSLLDGDSGILRALIA